MVLSSCFCCANLVPHVLWHPVLMAAVPCAHLHCLALCHLLGAVGAKGGASFEDWQYGAALSLQWD